MVGRDEQATAGRNGGELSTAALWNDDLLFCQVVWLSHLPALPAQNDPDMARLGQESSPFGQTESGDAVRK